MPDSMPPARVISMNWQRRRDGDETAATKRHRAAAGRAVWRRRGLGNGIGASLVGLLGSNWRGIGAVAPLCRVVPGDLAARAGLSRQPRAAAEHARHLAQTLAQQAISQPGSSAIKPTGTPTRMQRVYVNRRD